MICRLPVDLLPSGLWYPFVRKTAIQQFKSLATALNRVSQRCNVSMCWCLPCDLHHKTEGIVVKKNLTELVFILDRSGSMGGLEQDTIGGFNAMLTRRRSRKAKPT